jgi:hypothetical protein
VDCPAGAITTRMGRVESAEGPKSYKHRDDLKLPASASQDPGAQLIFQLQIRWHLHHHHHHHHHRRALLTDSQEGDSAADGWTAVCLSNALRDLWCSELQDLVHF